MAIQNVEIARDLSALVRLLVQAGVDERAIKVSLSSVCNLNDLGEAASRWVFQATLPPHPIPAADHYRPMENAGDLKKLALRFRNCMRNYLVDVLDEQSAFALISDGKTEAVAHLVQEEGRWLLDGVYGPRNDRPDANLKKSAIAYLSLHDVQPRKRRSEAAGRWACLRRLTGMGLYDW